MITKLSRDRVYLCVCNNIIFFKPVCILNKCRSESFTQIYRVTSILIVTFDSNSNKIRIFFCSVPNPNRFAVIAAYQLSVF